MWNGANDPQEYPDHDEDGPTRRWGTHYETLPHDNCYDPKHCDCACPACARVKEG